MKGRVIVIDMVGNRPGKAALIVDGRVQDLLIDPSPGDTTPRPGEIYWAKVDRLVPKMGGAFVSLTSEHQGYIRETKGLREGAGILVQVSGYPDPGKATPVTARLLYKGRRIIHTPDAPGINISRQIRDTAERDRLQRLVEHHLASRDGADGQDPGFILRTAARDAPEDELTAELDAVFSAHQRLLAMTSEDPNTPRALIPVDARLTALTEWSAPLPDAIHLPDHVKKAPDAIPFFQLYPCRDVTGLIQCAHPDPFDQFGVWDEIERLRSPRADLPSGGWMAIEATSAMVTVDVNTGAEFAGGAAMTANIEAARDLPRQLRLRGLGGQVTIDFAPLKKMHRRKIEEELKRAFARDPVATTLAGWTPLGNFELQRKRERRPIAGLL